MSDHSNDVVSVGIVPNVPIAEMIVEQLRNDGIEAFFKTPEIGSWGVTGVTGPAGPCEIFVGPEDAERARRYLPSD